MLHSAWANFSGLKKTFNSADYVKPSTVFDVGGNKYRVIAWVNYEIQAVAIEHVLIHAEYDKGVTPDAASVESVLSWANRL